MLLAVGLCLISESICFAGGFSVTTFGSRRTGMLANLASNDEITALFHNPACLADQKGFRSHVSNSFSFVDTKFELQALDQELYPDISCSQGESCDWAVGQDGYYEDDIKPLSTFGMLPYVGVSKSLADGLVVSAAITAPNFYAGAVSAESPASYFFIEGHFVVLSSMLGVGWRINDKIAIGGTLMYNYMQLEYAQRYSLVHLIRRGIGKDNPLMDQAAPILQDQYGDLRLDFGGDDHGMGWTLGILYSPTPWLSFGLSYNDATDARAEGGVKISPVREDISQATFDEAITSFNIKLPHSLMVEMPIPPFISAGMNVKVGELMEIGFDCRLWLYNVYEEQVIEPFYHEGEGIEPLTKEALTSNKDYSLSYDLSLGVLVRPISSLRTLEFMGGIGFDKSPVPDRYFTIDNPSMDNWRFSLGARWNVQSGLRVALTYMFIGYLGRDVTDSAGVPPLNTRTRGSNQFPRLELEYIF